MVQPVQGLRRRVIGRRAAMAALLGAAACQRPSFGLSHTLPFVGAETPLRPLGTMAINTAVLGADGLSGLHVGPDLTLTTIADRGRWCQARLVLAPDGRPLRLEAPRSGPLRDIASRPLPRALLSDAECLAALPDGSWLVGFERLHRIWRYRRLDGPAEPVRVPAEFRRAPSNGALESLGVLPDGRWLAISEAQLAPGDDTARMAWVGGPGGWQRFAYRPAPGHYPSDLCPLPDGGALVLERHFTPFEGFSARIRRLPPIPAAPGLMEGQEVAHLAPPLPSDNWEGISAFRYNGRDLVAVVSDDNSMLFQRTLLMVLAWASQAAS
ncbi:esterase-like activity of phytase family protein [Roseomonas harenae]|uniref:esterase-like activity of phytase family protein n=1 Tax=Muricoccus harenae TaxID=2692566 RepID=UPI00133133A9|nr:esterase-like activity of phytase family protein [Roseomonas harenae]